MTFADRIRQLRIPGYGEDEVVFMHDTVQKVVPDGVLEWGTNVGSSARIFRESLNWNGWDSVWVYTFDLPASLASIDRDHAGILTSAQIAGVPGIWMDTGDGVTMALEMCVHHGLVRPLFFVDGDHSYENVVRELRYIRRVAPTAAMLLHDTRGHPGRAARQVCGETYQIDGLDSQAGMMRVWMP